MNMFSTIKRDPQNYTTLIMTSNDPAAPIKEMRVANWSGPMPTTEAELNQGIKDGSRAEGAAYVYTNGMIVFEDIDRGVHKNKIQPTVIDIQAKAIYQ